VAEPFDPHVLTPPANTLPQMPGASTIAAAPVSIPPTPSDSPAISQPLPGAAPQSFAGAPFSTAAPVSGTTPAPRVVAQLKPKAPAAAPQAGAKPFVPTAKATKPKPASKPAATKPAAKPPGPLDPLLEFLAPLGNGKAAPVPSGNRK
jgi:hypothetical protein